MKSTCEPNFSIVMPTYNRAFCIFLAIDSLIAQEYKNWELIIVDDGSTDNTKDLLEQKYNSYLLNKKIIYKYVEKKGASNARNVGLKLANNEWIAYLDTDNIIKPEFLKEYKNYILKYPKCKCFYSKIRTFDSDIIGNKFSYKKLCISNFIDMGCFVHKKELVDKYGNFDANLKRLIDWDLILRYTYKNKPIFINKELVEYNSNNNFSRITNAENIEEALSIVCNKNKKMLGLMWYIYHMFYIEDIITHRVIHIMGLKIKMKKTKNN